MFTKIPFDRVATTAKWSVVWMSTASVLSVLFLIPSHDLESLLCATVLTWLTYREIKVNKGFKMKSPSAPRSGVINQMLFATLILIYGVFHAITAPSSAKEITSQLAELGVQDPSISHLIEETTIVTYLAVGVIGSFGQLLVALKYHRSAPPIPPPQSSETLFPSDNL